MDFIKGVDISSLLEVERCGGIFRDSGEELDALEILRRYGVNWVRLRLWNDPYNEKGESYGGGVCDLPSVLTLAQRAERLGMRWLLDFHYSDFWTDPGCQTCGGHRRKGHRRILLGTRYDSRGGCFQYERYGESRADC